MRGRLVVEINWDIFAEINATAYMRRMEREKRESESEEKEQKTGEERGA